MIKGNTEKSDSKLSWVKTLSILLPFLSEHVFSIIVVILMMLIGAGIVIALGFGASQIVDSLPEEPALAAEYLDQALYITVAAIFVLAVLRFSQNYMLIKVASRVIEAIRCRVFNNISDQDLAYFDRQHSGDMQTRIVSDISVVGEFISSQIPINLSSFVRLCGGLIGAILVSAELTLAVLIAIPILFLPFFAVAQPLRNISKLVQTATSNVGVFAGESFRNVKIVQAYNKKAGEKKHFSKLCNFVVLHSLKRARLQYSMGAIINALAMIGASLLLWSSAKNIYVGEMSIGQLVSFGYFVFLIVTAASKFINSVSEMNSAVGSAEKIVDYLRLEKFAWPDQFDDFRGTGNIEFKSVYFSYPNRLYAEVLHGIDLVIESGTHVAIVGPSGAGKSTLLELLLRLYDLEKGKVSIGGIDVKEIDVEKLRSTIGFVPQKETLVSGTVLDNICYGVEKQENNEELARTAAQKVGLDEFILQLPDGYRTDLGEVGNRLSGGQKQRISLARALLRNPQVLLLDEANSALDVESDRYVANSIKKWAKSENSTVVTIAHRLETARHADLIVVMDGGVIVGKGKHADLLNDCAVYRNLFSETKATNNNLELEPA